MSLIIAEIGTSHEGNLQKAFELIDEAKNSGADCVKFQWVYADEILHPKTGFVKLPGGNIRLYDRFKNLECPKDFYKKLKEYSKKKNIKFCCSPFGIRSLNELLQIEPDFVKIASPELNHIPMLEFLKEKRKNSEEKIPVILSSGVSKLKDIENAIEILGTKNVFLLHCITSYPAPENEYNVKLVQNLSSIFGIQTGISDHSLNPVLVPSLSIAFGGKIVEKHITLSKKTSGLDDPVALEGEEFSQMVNAIHQSEALIRHYGKNLGKQKIIEQLSEQFGKEKIDSIIGDGIKKLANSEKQNYGRTNRSLHFMKDLKKGEKITEKDVSVLRTEKELLPGILPEFLPKIIGSVLSRDVQNGKGVQLEDFLFTN